MARCLPPGTGGVQDHTQRASPKYCCLTFHASGIKEDRQNAFPEVLVEFNVFNATKWFNESGSH